MDNLLNELKFILPELFLIAGSFITLMCGAYFTKRPVEAATSLSIVTIFCSLLLLAAQAVTFYFNDPFDFTILNDSLILDRFAIFFKFLILISGFLMMAMLYPSIAALKESKIFELSPLILLGLSGMMFMVSSFSLISLYVSMEMMSLPLYILASSRRENSLSTEAGMKYFILGSLSSGLFLFGASLVYGFTGEITWIGIFNNIENVLDPALLFGIIFIIISFCFKISAAPFHMWAPDVYQGAPTLVTSFFASAPKVAAFGLLCRLLFDCFYGAANQWQQVIMFIAVISMFIGSLGAIMQKNFKRLLAYSSIGHVGFALCGVATTEETGLVGVLLYLAIYITMTIAAFACILVLKVDGKNLEKLHDLKGLSKKHPYISFALAILMLSMAGIPPLAGFFSKLFILLPLISSKLYLTSLLFVTASIISAYYYLKVVKYLYFDSSAINVTHTNALAFSIVIFVSTAFNIFFILSPSFLVNIAKATVEMFIRTT